MSNLFCYDIFARGECEAFFSFFRECGCSFFSCLDLGISPSPRGVSFRYDVHVRDIPGSYGFLAAHYRHGIPGTFFLLPDYSGDERAALPDFRRLARRIKGPLEIGLHDSPVDSYLINRKFDGIGIEYWRWLQSDQSLPWFAALAESEPERERFHADVMEAFCGRVTTMKREFGDFATMASHGGEINQMFRKRLPELGSTGEFISSLFAENWITPERLASVGLEADVEQFRKKAPLFYQVTDGGGLIRRMADNAALFARERGRAVQILIHPYTWAGPLVRTGGVRDGEVSVLLGHAEDAGPMGGRKWWQRLLRTRLAVPRGAVPVPAGKAGEPPCAATAQPFILLSATVDDSAADARHAGRTVEAARIVTVEGGGASSASFPDYLHGERPEGAEVVPGRSLERYGPLVSGALRCLAGGSRAGEGEAGSAERALAQWMAQQLDEKPPGHGTPRLERKELSYFLFSSSQRSHVLKRVLDHFFPDRAVDCLVDHGAGIGIVSLCATFACDNRVKSVVCSEVKHDFVTVGTHLWQSVGYGDLIRYQECSAVDFAYPPRVSAVLFAQMLYRIEPQKRGQLLACAWEALEPGGVLVINELMDRDATVAHQLLSSHELLAWLPQGKDGMLFWGGAAGSVIDLGTADRKLFTRSDNFIVVRK